MTQYIEDAIQEVTVLSAGVSAEYGRFAGGVANAITKSGGNTFSGSFRTSFANDSWRSFTPYESTQLITNPFAARSSSTRPFRPTRPRSAAPFGRIDCGSSARCDRRSRNRSARRLGRTSRIPAPTTSSVMKASSPTPRESGHSMQGSYFKLNQVLENFTGQNVADLQSLTNQGQPQDLVSVQYTGVITSNFSLSGQYSARSFALTNTGANTTDRINGTLVLDLQNGYRYWSPTFCAGSVCDGDEQRDNENVVRERVLLSDQQRIRCPSFRLRLRLLQRQHHGEHAPVRQRLSRFAERAQIISQRCRVPGLSAECQYHARLQPAAGAQRRLEPARAFALSSTTTGVSTIASP